MENYFNYFTEIEEHFQKRRGTGLILNTLDWALIETWKDTGVPLEAVIRGIDTTFDHYEQRPSKTKKVNSLGFCAQEILAAAEEMKQTAAGSVAEVPAKPTRETGFETATVIEFLKKNADRLEQAKLPEPARKLARDSAASLREIAVALTGRSALRLEDLERRLTVMEEKLQAALLTATPDDKIVAIRAEADRDMAPYRRNMPATQIEQLQRQYIHKRLLESYGLPRLSLFYM